jgi:hypothetical protein
MATTLSDDELASAVVSFARADPQNRLALSLAIEGKNRTWVAELVSVALRSLGQVATYTMEKLVQLFLS